MGSRCRVPENKKNYDMPPSRNSMRSCRKIRPIRWRLPPWRPWPTNLPHQATHEQKNAALADARKWNQRRIEVDPKDAEAYYYLGVIDWAQAFPPSVMRVPRPSSRRKTPDQLRTLRFAKTSNPNIRDQINHGIDDLQKCLDIDKENDDAMSYMNLLYREKAVLEDTPDAAKADVAKAEEWANKMLDMRKIKAARPAKKTQAS